MQTTVTFGEEGVYRICYFLHSRSLGWSRAKTETKTLELTLHKGFALSDMGNLILRETEKEADRGIAKYGMPVLFCCVRGQNVDATIFDSVQLLSINKTK